MPHSINTTSGGERLFKRIVHFIADDGPGGGPNTIIRHIKYYFKEYDLGFIYGGSGRVAEFCKKNGINHKRLPTDRLWKCLWGWIPLFLELKKLQPDLLIVHGQWAAPLGAMVGRLAGIKKIIYIAHWPAFYTDWDLYRVVRNHLVESIPVHLCDKVVCISPGNHYQYQIRFPRQMGKLVMVPNPFDLENLPPPEKVGEIRQKWGWTNELVHVVSVGRIATQKHLEWLLESWVIVQKEVPGARLWIVGDGEEEARMKQLAIKLEISHTCTFLGAQLNGIDFIHAADIVAMTTLYEGHANIPMEAHLCGKPIVANSVDGIRLSINDGEDGFLVQAADIETFAERLIALCRSPELRENMGRVGRKNVERFSMDKVMLKYTDLIRSII